MNEPSNFQNGDESPSNSSDLPAKNFDGIVGDVNSPTYSINNFNSHAPLNTKTLAMDAIQFPSQGPVQHYYVHNLYGHSEAIATHNALKSIQNRRPFVLSRSTFPSGGRYTAHWLGDNHSQYSDMYYSIAGILDFSLFGIPFTGADICGFNGDTTEELCCRWMALGSFYPFARNHNAKGQIPQEPYNWQSVTRVAQKCLGARYSLLPYYYTLFQTANAKGGTVARPLWFEFPNDKNTWPIDSQLMIGPGVLITPVLTQGATTVTGYFPNANWYSFWDGTPLGTTGTVTLSCPMEDIQIHVRGGIIIPMQNSALTTAVTRKLPYQLLVPLDNNQKASGSLYLDDGISNNVGSQYTSIQYNATAGQLTGTVIQANYNSVPALGMITVLGISSSVSTVKVNDASTPFTFDTSSRKLTIQNLSLSMLSNIVVTWG
jgi:alpha-glucosidase (family GH31 glycosyl hydrolase)